jgi:hypothetical protein
MSSDRFAHHSDSPMSPSRHAFAIVPSDTLPLSPVPKALFAGGAGSLVLRTIDSDADVTLAVQAGQILPLRAVYVRASGTSATGLVALA